jgi:predicted PurR-regulated permease PerM
MPTPLGNPGGNVSPDLPPFFTSLLCNFIFRRSKKMRLIKRLAATAFALTLSLFLLPMLLVVFLVSTWRMTGLMQRLRERMPIDGEYQREDVVLRPVPVEVKNRYR